jgi:hypothetical protein
VKRLFLLLALIPAASAAGDLAPEPSEQAKVEALKLGYMLNDNSMARDISLGSIDVSGVSSRNLTPPPPGVIRTIPITPGKTEKPVTMPEAAEAKPEKKVQSASATPVADICARHGKRRIVRGSSWRCSR